MGNIGSMFILSICVANSCIPIMLQGSDDKLLVAFLLSLVSGSPMLFAAIRRLLPMVYALHVCSLIFEINKLVMLS